MALDPGHQLTGDALAAEIRMDQQFADFGAVRLVGRRIMIELHRSGDAAIAPGDEQKPPSVAHRRDNLVAPESGTVDPGMWHDETNAGAIVHAGVDELGQILDMPRDVIRIDGLRVEYADGFGLARSSNTTPVIVLRFEADDDAALERIQEDFRRVILAVKPDAQLPF